MALIKRIFLFIAINILVVTTISALLYIFNIQPYLQAYGFDLYYLAIFCLIWGFLGAFISLALSKYLAKWLMKVQIIDLVLMILMLRVKVHGLVGIYSYLGKRILTARFVMMQWLGILVLISSSKLL